MTDAEQWRREVVIRTPFSPTILEYKFHRDLLIS